MTQKDLTCEVTCIHQEVVKRVKNSLIDQQTVQRVAAIYKALGDPTRLKILLCLKEEEMCVCDIANILDMTQSAISHQLRVLRNIKLVKYRKEGKMVYYSLDDDHIFEILDAGLEHINHE